MAKAIEFEDAQQHLFDDEVVRVHSPDFPNDVDALDYSLKEGELMVRISPSTGHIWHRSMHGFIETVPDKLRVSSAEAFPAPSQSAQSQAAT